MANEYNKKSNQAILLLILVVVVAILVIILLPGNKDKTPHDTDVAIDTSERTIPVQNRSGDFSDGLANPTTVNRSSPDEFGVGVTEIAEYTYDINQDGRPDKIVRTRKETGTAHFQYIYKILLNSETGLVDITPKDFFTIEGTECALQKIQFSFEPDFFVTKISRPLGNNWYAPTQSTKTVYSLWANKMRTVSEIVYKTVCDVSELF